MKSTRWKEWKSRLDPKTCPECRKNHGRIYDNKENLRNLDMPPLHPNCRCAIVWLGAVYAGEALKDSRDTADWWMAMPGKLSNKYTSFDYANASGRLPSGRTWQTTYLYYENQNAGRVVFSNDGLIFVTYDKYMTFVEVIKTNIELPKNTIKAGNPGSKTWNEAVKQIQDSKGKGVNIEVGTEAEAKRLINDARPDLQQNITYSELNGYEIHPAEPDVNNDLPHIMWEDWSEGKSQGIKGHIFFGRNEYD